jgi:hypothetical protein
MHSFTSLAGFAIVAISLTAAAPAPLAQLNARQSSDLGNLPGFSIFGGTNGVIGTFNPGGLIQGTISQEISELEGVSSEIDEAEAFGENIFASFESNPTVSAAVASASAAVASIASEVNSALPVASALPSLAARQYPGFFGFPARLWPFFPYPEIGAAQPAGSAAASAASAVASSV